MTDFWIISIGVALAFFAQGFTSFGAAMILVPILLTLMAPHEAMPLIAVLTLIANSTLSIIYRHSLDTKLLKALLTTAIPGIFLGTWILKNINGKILETLFSAIIISFVFYSLIDHKRNKPWPNWVRYPIGFLSGVSGGAINLNGPPVVILAHRTKTKKEELKALMSAYFAISSLSIVGSYAMASLFTQTTAVHALHATPFLAGGLGLGIFFSKKVDHEFFRKIIGFCLIAIALRQLVQIFNKGL